MTEHQVRNAPVVLLIGQGKMPVQCAEMLVSAGYDLAGVHSPDEPLRDWTRQQGLPCFIPDFAHFRGWGETIAFDYLFSVINFRLLPLSLLQRAQRLAINYHDSPLPRYAGSHAVEWALYNDEPLHGSTWHVIEEKVDSGDILKQCTFPVAPGETAESLSQKCYLAGMRAFRQLLVELKTGSYTRTPQNLTQRTFYKRSERPPTTPVTETARFPSPIQM